MRRIVPQVRAPVRYLIYLRFARYLLYEFRWPLIIFTLLVVSGGWILHLFYHGVDHGVNLSFARACHAVFLLIFLESSLEFPDEWYLQPLFFILPIMGLGAIADSVVRLAYLIFTRKQNLPEWNRMLASLCRNHFVVIGVGKVGYQVIKQLLEMRETVVAIEMASGSPLLGELFDKGVPVVQGNARMASVLEQAGVRKARSVIITTSDDLTNLDAAITARDLNATAKIVIRLFDETLATKVAGAFSMPTISTSQVAAPAFIAAATGRKIYQGFQLAGQYVHFTDLTICPTGRLVGLSVGDLQSDKRINIVMQQGSLGVNVNPDPHIVLEPGDTILVIAPMDALLTLEAMNQPHEDATPAPIPLRVPVPMPIPIPAGSADESSSDGVNEAPEGLNAAQLGSQPQE
jgi:voltage-gated potassium channel